MHECPQCWQVCYCDLDDSNDCRDNGACFHACPPEDVDGFSAFDDDDGDAPAPAPTGDTATPSPRPSRG